MAVYCGEARESAAHTPADDWASFFHVLSWVVLRFTKHGLTSAELTHELRNTYDDSYLDCGKVYGGMNKEKGIKSRFISTHARILLAPFLISSTTLLTYALSVMKTRLRLTSKMSMTVFWRMLLEIHL